MGDISSIFHWQIPIHGSIPMTWIPMEKPGHHICFLHALLFLLQLFNF